MAKPAYNGAAHPGWAPVFPRDTDPYGRVHQGYTAEWNRLASEQRTDSIERNRKLVDLKRRIGGILDAIERGIIAPTTKERLEELEAEKSELESVPLEMPTSAMHPNLAERYWRAVTQLQEVLADPELAAAAKSTLRALIKTIKVYPGAKRGEVSLELHGEFAGIMHFAQQTRAKGSHIQVSVVAGACNHLDLQRQQLLAATIP